MKEFRYFVSYFYTTTGNDLGFGNAVVTQTVSLSSSEAIRGLAERLTEEIPFIRQTVTILSFQELK